MTLQKTINSFVSNIPVLWEITNEVQILPCDITKFDVVTSRVCSNPFTMGDAIYTQLETHTNVTHIKITELSYLKRLRYQVDYLTPKK